MPNSKKMRKERSRSSTTRHRQRSSSSSEYPCDYLQMVLSKKKMQCICDALDIFYDSSTTKAQLCTSIEMHRPDLMRSWKWNVLRTVFRVFDFQNMNLLKDIVINCLTGVPGLYASLEVITYLLNDKRYAVGHGLFALERQDARKLMGYDTRKRSKESYEIEKALFLQLHPNHSNKKTNVSTPLYSQLTTQEKKMLTQCLTKHALPESISVRERKAVCLTMNDVSMIRKYDDTYAEVIAPNQYKTVSKLNSKHKLFRSKSSFYTVPKNDMLARSGKDGTLQFHARPVLELFKKNGWL